MSLARVMLIDDDVFTRTTLSAALASFGVLIVGQGATAAQALQIVAAEKPEVAIVDLDLGPGPSGVDICHALRERDKTIGLILLTSYLDQRVFDPHSPQLPKGARFVSKGEVTELRNLVQEILIVRHQPLSQSRSPKRVDLSDAQLDVLRMVAEGLSTSQIAEIRGVSVKGVDALIAKTNLALGIHKSRTLNQRVQLARAYFQLAGKKPPRV